jgi:hypothetical protein
MSIAAILPMRAAFMLLVALLSGCEAARVYFHESEGISAAQLLPISQQEHQYVDDRNLAAKVRAVVGPGVEVDVYLKDVTLKGAGPGDVEKAKSIAGVKSVKAQ